MCVCASACAQTHGGRGRSGGHSGAGQEDNAEKPAEENASEESRVREERSWRWE